MTCIDLHSWEFQSVTSRAEKQLVRRAAASHGWPQAVCLLVLPKIQRFPASLGFRPPPFRSWKLLCCAVSFSHQVTFLSPSSTFEDPIAALVLLHNPRYCLLVISYLTASVDFKPAHRSSELGHTPLWKVTSLISHYYKTYLVHKQVLFDHSRVCF
jgi:hypothetical protein